MKRYLAYGYWATVLGGLMLAAGSALSLMVGTEPFSAKTLTGVFMVSSAMRLVGAAAMVIGLSAIFVGESDHAGRFGLVAYSLVIVNMLVQAAWMWSDLFVTGALATYAPRVLDGTVDDSRLSAGFLLAWFMNATFILLGAATLRARMYAKAVGWALIVMGAITLVPLPFDGPVYEIVIGAACIVAGLSARRVPVHAPGSVARDLVSG